MRRNIIIASVVALLMLSGIVAYLMLKRSSDGVASSLPKDITMVARVDFQSLAVHYGLSGDHASSIMHKLLWYSDDDIDGIDYLSNSYAFASQGYFGAVVPLKDSKRFKQFVEQARSCRFEQQRGLSWAVVDFNVLLAVSNDRAMMMGPAVGAELDELRNTIAACLKQSEEESGMHSELFGMLAARNEPITLATTYDALPAQLQPEGLGQYVNFSSLYATAGLTAMKDRASLSIEFSSTDDKMNRILDKFDEALQPINGNLLQTAPSNPALHVEMGLNGEHFLNTLRSIPHMRTKLLFANALLDLDMIIKSIDGDVAFSISDNWVVQTEMHSMKFLDNVSGWNDDITRTAGIRFDISADKSHGSVLYKDNRFYYGVRGNRLVCSPNEQLSHADAHNDVKYDFNTDLSQYSLFATVEAYNSFIDEYLPKAERVNIAAKDIRHWSIDLIVRDGATLLDIF